MAGKDKSSLWRQAQRNAVAIISLLVALSTLSYSTWRNEKSEDNRNHRQAAFEVLLKLNELQQVIFHRHYDMDEADKGNPRLGWTIVLTISDLSQLLPPANQREKTSAPWQTEWEPLQPLHRRHQSQQLLHHRQEPLGVRARYPLTACEHLAICGLSHLAKTRAWPRKKQRPTGNRW